MRQYEMCRCTHAKSVGVSNEASCGRPETRWACQTLAVRSSGSLMSRLFDCHPDNATAITVVESYCFKSYTRINVERDQHGVWKYIFIGARPLTQHRVLRTAWEDSTLLDTQTLILMSNVIICLERFKRFNLQCMLLFL